MILNVRVVKTLAVEQDASSQCDLLGAEVVLVVVWYTVAPGGGSAD